MERLGSESAESRHSGISDESSEKSRRSSTPSRKSLETAMNKGVGMLSVFSVALAELLGRETGAGTIVLGRRSSAYFPLTLSGRLLPGPLPSSLYVSLDELDRPVELGITER
jgi:hypothetical protein